MNFDSQVESLFYDFLLKIGYPKEAIVYEPPLSGLKGLRSYIPDFAIYDSNKKEYVALIEVKGEKGILEERKDFYSSIAKEQRIPFYLVNLKFDQKGEKEFFISYCRPDGEWCEMPESKFPPYSSLTKDKMVVKKNEIFQQQNQFSGDLKNICFKLARVGALIFLFDVLLASLGFTFLTNMRLIVLGVSVVLVVIPFVQKLKGLGFEFESNEKSNKEQKSE